MLLTDHDPSVEVGRQISMKLKNLLNIFLDFRMAVNGGNRKLENILEVFRSPEGECDLPLGHILVLL